MNGKPFGYEVIGSHADKEKKTRIMLQLSFKKELLTLMFFAAEFIVRRTLRLLLLLFRFSICMLSRQEDEIKYAFLLARDSLCFHISGREYCEWVRQLQEKNRT